MFKLRLAILGAGAALAFGTASAMAMTAGFSINNHGSVVSSAARTTCRTVTTETRGACVSAIASTNGQANRDGARAKAVHACMTANGGMKGATQAQRQAIVACITGKTPRSSSPPSGN